jgi:hypothetical protein
MESHQRLHLIATLNEEADRKRLALTQEEQALKYERDLWERLQLSLNEAEKILRELEQLEQDRGVSAPR